MDVPGVEHELWRHNIEIGQNITTWKKQVVYFTANYYIDLVFEVWRSEPYGFVGIDDVAYYISTANNTNHTIDGKLPKIEF